jgi:alpha-aminoadipate carrier protein LysW
MQTLTRCPECDRALDLHGTRRNEIVDCPDCGSELEVVSTTPMVLMLAPEAEQDWGE